MKNITKHTAKDGYKLCTDKDCLAKGISQPVSMFNKNASRNDGYFNKCRPCNKRLSKTRKKYKTKHTAVNGFKLCTNSTCQEINPQTILNFTNDKKSFDGLSHTCKTCKHNYLQANKAKYNAHSSKRRATKLQRTPLWANLNDIKRIYQECIRISAETGIEHHVDHIIPLQGNDVSGLHVENNLQIITATANMKKYNSFNT